MEEYKSVDELKEHFKNVSKIKCLMDERTYEVENCRKNIEFDGINSYWVNTTPDNNGNFKDSVLIYQIRERKLAEIIE